MVQFDGERWRTILTERRDHEEADRLRDEVGKALKAYLSYVTDGEAIVVSWVAGADITTMEMEQTSVSQVLPVAPRDTSAAHIRGILEHLKEQY